MSLTPRWAWLGLVLVLCGPVFARNMGDAEKPVKNTPKKALTRLELDRREAQRLYGVAALHERSNRLVEAVRAYEQARKLDPESAAIPRALFALYLAIDRTDDALAAAEKVLKLDPEDCQTAYAYARQLRGLERWKDAIAALMLATKSPKMKDRPDLGVQAWFDLGMLHEQAKDWANAEKALRHVASLLDNPEMLIESGRVALEEVASQAAESLERLGRVCLQAKRIDAAVEAFEAAKKKDAARAPRLAYNLAQVFRDQGKHREALEQVNVYLQSQPQGVDGYEMKIALQLKLGRQRDILPQLAGSSGRDPNNAGLKLLLAKEYRAARRAGEAEKIYASLLETNVTPEVYRDYFTLLREQGPGGVKTVLSVLDAAMKKAIGDENEPKDPGDARRARAMLIVLREDAGLVKLLLPAAIMRARTRKDDGLSRGTRGTLATLAARTRQLPEAEKLYRSCLENPRGGTLEHEAYSGLLRVLEMQRKYAEVIEVSKQGLRTAQATNRVLFHLYQVAAYQHLDDHRSALEAAEMAVKDSGKDEMPSARRTKVNALVQAGEHLKALAECQAMVKDYDNKAGELRDARYSLSNVLQAMGRLDEAEEQLELILKTDPNDATANNDLGYLRADRGKDLAESEKMIRKALELDRQQRTTGVVVDTDSDKENAAYVDSLGWVLFRLGKLSEAREQLEKASRLPGGEDDPVVWDHLGDVLFRMDEPGKAKESWKKAISLYEQGTRRKADGRHREIQEKIRQAKP